MPTSNTSILWNVPYQRNLFFTGREDILNRLHRTLQADTTVALSHPQGISGLGGIGKTQTALEYAYRYRTDYNAVFWVRADSVTALTSSLAELVHVLELPERYEQDQEIIIQAVLRWLRTNRDWLLVFDGMDDLSVAEPLLPKAGSGHLLFTTRAHALGGIAQRLEVQKMEPETGALLLLRRADILPLLALLESATNDDRSRACKISQELDGLPLAIDQAGAYIKETPCTLMDYVTLYQERRRDLLETRGSFEKDYPASVATTWSLSFEKVSQTNPAAANLLDFCAFLAPDAIPEEVITTSAQYLAPSFQMTVPMQFDQAIAALLAYSLVSRNTNATLDIHRLVQAVLRDGMDEQTRHLWAERTVQAVKEVFPEVEFTTWSQCERYLPHALVCAESVKQEQISSPDVASLLYDAGRYLVQRFRPKEAEPLLQQALFLREQHFGQEHPDTANALDRLAAMFEIQGRYENAEPLFKRALAIREQQLGDEHPDTATSLNNLAALSYYQGKYEQAESLYKRALSIYEQQLGGEHLDAIRGLNNLAELYRVQGKYIEAEPLYRRALVIREQQLGDEHPDTAVSLNNLALLYKNQGKYIEAEPLYRRALAIREQQLGDEHPDTAMGLNNLAELYRVQGKYEEAEPLYRRALAIREQQLGDEHPNTATSLNGLALLYKHQGKYEEAESLFQRALTIREQTLGPEHPYTAISLSYLAELYSAQGKYEQAEPLYQRALAIHEQRLGVEHPFTARSLHGLAELYRHQGKYEQAEALYQRALVIREQRLGSTHPDTQETRRAYAALLRLVGRDAEAMGLDKSDHEPSAEEDR